MYCPVIVPMDLLCHEDISFLHLQSGIFPVTFVKENTNWFLDLPITFIEMQENNYIFQNSSKICRTVPVVSIKSAVVKNTKCTVQHRSTNLKTALCQIAIS